MDPTITSSNNIEVVLKVTERCNINCTYCYVFNKGNLNYQSKPKMMSRAVMKDTVAFVSRGAEEMSSHTVGIVFHGGEPLMMAKSDFDIFASDFSNALEGISHCQISIQTNAMLIDDEWIDLFERHRVNVGVSIDGIKPIHDFDRVDFKSRGTYERTVKGLKMLQLAAKQGRLREPAIICVVNPNANGRETYNHFVNELSVKNISFHLPMDTHDSFLGKSPLPYAQFVCDAFDTWLLEGDQGIRIRMFDQLLGYLQGKIASTAGRPTHLNMQHVTIESDGSIDIDELKPTNLQLSPMNVASNTLLEYANSPVARFVRQVYGSLSNECLPCVWRNYCKGGLVHGVQVNRWSNAKGFDNPSILCGALRTIYSHVTATMISAGFREDGISAILSHENRTFTDASELRAPLIH